MTFSTEIKLNDGFQSSVIRKGNKAYSSTFYHTLPAQISVAVAATIITSAVTLPPQPINPGSASTLGIQSPHSAKLLSQSAITTFVTELQSQSKSLSFEDAQILRKVILSKSKPGIPRF